MTDIYDWPRIKDFSRFKEKFKQFQFLKTQGSVQLNSFTCKNGTVCLMFLQFSLSGCEKQQAGLQTLSLG
jgi:hypothetical protein